MLFNIDKKFQCVKRSHSLDLVTGENGFKGTFKVDFNQNN